MKPSPSDTSERCGVALRSLTITLLLPRCRLKRSSSARHCCAPHGVTTLAAASPVPWASFPALACVAPRLGRAPLGAPAGQRAAACAGPRAGWSYRDHQLLSGVGWRTTVPGSAPCCPFCKAWSRLMGKVAQDAGVSSLATCGHTSASQSS